MTATPAPVFTVPPGLAATEPPEQRGLARDAVRLLAVRPEALQHNVFRDLPSFLRPGDLLVVNTSATVAAAVDGARSTGGPVAVHFSTARDDGTWVVELRRPDGTGPVWDADIGEVVRLPAGVRLTLLAPAASSDSAGGRTRLWLAHVGVEGGVLAYLDRVGRPITYGYLSGRWPLGSYQTVFARHPGSAEMASAGRPFSHELVTALVPRGVVVAPVLLHAGVSSPEVGEPPQAERFAVPDATAALVNHTLRQGGRVVAVGTTVTRALETVAAPDGSVRAGHGWTRLVLSEDRPARVVSGLVTGWHEPGSSHLQLLRAVAGSELVERAYAAALAEGYLWHEFGDSCLLLP